MSIEQAIAENTVAIVKLAEAINVLISRQTASCPNADGATGGNVSQAQAAEPETKQSKAKKQQEPAATPEQKEEVAVADDEAKAPEPVTYDQCAGAITSLAKGKGRAAAVEVLKSFGAEKLPDVKDDAEKLAAIYAAATAALEA